MPEQGTAARATREVRPIKKEVGEIIDHVQKLSAEVAHRAYEIFEESGRKVGLDLAHWFQAESELLHPVHVRVAETTEASTVRAEVPDFEAKDLDVRLEPRKVMIAGKWQATEGTPACFERCSDQILRVVNLSAEVDTTKAVAMLKDGILKLELPRVIVAKKVPIETAQ
jgi:HSP20 family protein